MSSLVTGRPGSICTLCESALLPSGGPACGIGAALPLLASGCRSASRHELGVHLRELCPHGDHGPGVLRSVLRDARALAGVLRGQHNGGGERGHKRLVRLVRGGGVESDLALGHRPRGLLRQALVDLGRPLDLLGRCWRNRTCDACWAGNGAGPLRVRGDAVHAEEEVAGLQQLLDEVADRGLGDVQVHALLVEVVGGLCESGLDGFEAVSLGGLGRHGG
mmetsp:Transcript_71127/g.230943  ORF Transcript_71127/g.230943 Transcript_71127/m.230943 type:complete len:220 (-) Transcript_71127:61-720(-)